MTCVCEKISVAVLALETCDNCNRIIKTKRYDWHVIDEAIKLLIHVEQNIKPTVFKSDNEIIKKRISTFLEKVECLN